MPSSIFFLQLAAIKILILEFRKDGPADNRDEFTCGGLANQPAIL